MVCAAPCEQCLPRPAPASGRGCSPGGAELLPLGISRCFLRMLRAAAPWELGGGSRGQAQRGSQRLGLAGIRLEHSKDVSLSCVESQQMSAGICPSLPTLVPPGQLWLLLPAQSWEHTRIKPCAVPCSLCQGRVAVPAALPAPHALLGFGIHILSAPIQFLQQRPGPAEGTLQ